MTKELNLRWTPYVLGGRQFPLPATFTSQSGNPKHCNTWWTDGPVCKTTQHKRKTKAPKKQSSSHAHQGLSLNH